MKIKVKEITKGCMPTIIKKGEWIDLMTAVDIVIGAPQALTQKQVGGEKVRDVVNDVFYIPLGVAMELPKGFEAIVASRSGTPKKHGIMSANSIGVIDNSYNGNEDEWKFPAISFRPTVIPKGTRICQFRVQLSQKATFWQKLRWFFSNKIELVQVDNLSETNRGGFGSTGN